jgi:hypothetical protein
MSFESATPDGCCAATATASAWRARRTSARRSNSRFLERLGLGEPGRRPQSATRGAVWASFCAPCSSLRARRVEREILATEVLRDEKVSHLVGSGMSTSQLAEQKTLNEPSLAKAKPNLFVS